MEISAQLQDVSSCLPVRSKTWTAESVARSEWMSVATVMASLGRDSPLE